MQLTNLTIGWTNAESFGAVGDGVTDDTIAISNALRSGLEIHFWHPFYLISQTVYPTNGSRLYGL